MNKYEVEAVMTKPGVYETWLMCGKNMFVQQCYLTCNKPKSKLLLIDFTCY